MIWQIIGLVFTAIITLMGSLANLRSRENGRLTRNGWIFAFLGGLAFAAGIYGTLIQDDIQGMKDKERKSTDTTIIKGVNEGLLRMERTLHRIDALNHDLDTLAVNTRNTIDLRDQALAGMDTVSIQLRKMSEYTRNEIVERMPEVSIRDISWSSRSEGNAIQAILENSGSRTATYLCVSMYFIKYRKETRKYTEARCLSMGFGRRDLLSYEKTDRWALYAVYDYPKTNTSDTLSDGVLIVHYTYLDALTDSLCVKHESYEWGVASQSTTRRWNRSNSQVEASARDYLVSQKINLIEAHDRQCK